MMIVGYTDIKNLCNIINSI